MQRMNGLTSARRRTLMILPVGILLAIGVATLVAYARVRAMGEMVVRAHGVIEAADRVSADLTDAETGQRGYLLTGREVYLAPYRRAAAALAADTVSLRRQTADNPQEAARLRRLLPVLDRKMGELEQTIELRRRDAGGSALRIVESDRGRTFMEASRSVLAALHRDETRVLEERVAGESARVRLLLLVFAGGLLLVVYAVVRASGLLAGYAAAQERALAHISEQNEELSAQRDALEETAAEMEQLNEELLDRTRAAEEAHAETEAERRRLSDLHALTVALSGTTTVEDVAHAAGHWGRVVMGAATALVVVPDDDGRTLVPVDVSGLPEEFVRQWPRIPVDAAAVIAEAARRGEVVRAESAAERDVLFPALGLRAGLEAALAAPLDFEGQRLGAWAIYFDRPRRFSPDELMLFEAVTEPCAQALERARLVAAERGARAEAERANESKVTFLSIMSHDVRTPLNAILGYAELLHSGYIGALSERQLDFLGRILASTEVLRTLVEEVLEYARIEAGRLEIRPSTLEVEPLLVRVHTMVAPLAAAKRIALESPAPPPVRVRGDMDRIGQILSNLATNAVKYTPEGGRVRVQAAADEACVEFRVADNGPGISPADMERIFEPFVQLDRSRPDVPGGGVGLGLAISRQLARAMGGELRADSRPGQTTFTLRLPRAA